MPLPYTDEVQILAGLEELKEELEKVNERLDHIDTQHWDKTGTTVPLAAILINEYHGNQDLDGNGLVYGRDFHISPHCPERPPMLASVPCGGDAVAWPDYLALAGA